MSNQQQLLKQQPRNPISLGSFDTTSQMYGADQPLSPTHVVIGNQDKERQDKSKDTKQKQLKGFPQLVGIATLEYAIDEGMQCTNSQIEVNDLKDNYLNQLYHESQSELDLNVMKTNTKHSKIHLNIKLPFEMLVEQIEIQLSNYEVFNKYLKFLKIEKNDQKHEKNALQIRGGFQDSNKQIIELNTCGATTALTLNFLFNKQAQQLPKITQSNNIDPIAVGQGLIISDKIQNDLFPLLHGSDDDIDELDDEVAMISNKKGVPDNQQIRMQDELQIDDIQFHLDDQFTNNNNNQQNHINQNKININDEFEKEQQEEEHTRNFNTFPRNYSDPAAQNKQNIHQDQENISHQNKSISKDNTQKNINYQEIYKTEQEIFNQTQKNENWYDRLLSKCIKSIKIIGFNTNSLPAVTNITQFINSSVMLKKANQHEEAMDMDFMVGILLISTKRNTQAAEMLRKIQAKHLQQIEQKMQIIQKAKESNVVSTKQTNQVNNQNQNSSNSFVSASNDKKIQLKQAQTNQLFIKCAIIELLVAESMNQTNQINEKLLSLKRMTELSLGKLVPIITYQQQIYFSEDPYTALIRILPSMLKFIIMCMTHKKEIVRLASLKQLEFVLETKGCSLDSAIVLILKALFKTYPNISNNQQLVSSHIESEKQKQSLKQSSLQNNDNIINISQQDNQQLTKNLNNDTTPPSKIISIKEPNSGFITALKNLYSHVLDTYISVLSSISSHILHQLFYEVIMPSLVSIPNEQNIQYQNEIKVFTIKIAEKIITICQGDLILSKTSLSQLLSAVTAKRSQSDILYNSIKNLWISIRTKVFTNYSQKGMKTLIEWLVEKMSQLSQGSSAGDLNSSNQDIAKLEITDEEMQQLSQLIDIVSLISIGRKKTEEEANSLIKIKQEYCQELYLLVNPLLFWLDFSVEREDRLNLFKAVYQTIKDVLDNLPPKRVDLDVLQIMIPILQRVSEYLKSNSPSLNMLKFLDIVLQDIKEENYCQQNPELQYFFLEMLNNFVSYISYCLYEEVFSVFDKLLQMCHDVINDKILTKCIVALVDKYTMKSKAHKSSLSLFMKSLMEVKMRKPAGSKTADKNTNNNNIDDDDVDDFEEDQLSVHSKNNYFEILTDFCFFNNQDPSKQKQTDKNKDFRNPIDQHDLFVDKLQLFIDSLGLLNELHINMFTSLITHPKFKSALLNLLNSGETSLRLKCHEILEIVTNYYVQYCTSKTVYELAVPSSSALQSDQTAAGANKRKQQQPNEVMEVEFINHERLYISQIMIQCVKISLDMKNDSYLQFNSLILLDFLFQNMLPVPTYQNEIFKNRGLSSQLSNNQNQSLQNNNEKDKDGIVDLETLEINETTLEYEVTEQKYINMRLNLIFKLWPYVQHALNSAWSNIRSICYGLICSMLKIDIRDYMPNSQGQSSASQQHFLEQLKQLILPMLTSLLSSKESESKAGGLNILGSFCGLSYDFSKIKISKNLEFFKKNTNFISKSIWQLVFDLQDDWDITIKEASVVLIQLCAPRETIKHFDKIKRAKEQAGFTRMLNKYGLNTERGQSQLSSRSLANQYSKQSIEEEYDQNAYLGNYDGGLLNQMAGDDELNILFESNQEQFSGIANEIFGLSNNVQSNNTNQKLPQSNAMAASNDFNALEYGDLEDLEGPDFQFFVDVYQDDQIQEIISIFRNDFKPPKNLWIEKNPSAAFNSPDYYGEVYSQAIEQYNQQQMHLQQQSQQQMQLQVSGSPKSSGSKTLIGDALEDDLVKRYENEKLEREKLKQGDQQNDTNFLIFERHFEDGKEGGPAQNEDKSATQAGDAKINDNEYLSREQVIKNETLSQPKQQQQEKIQSMDLQIIDEEDKMQTDLMNNSQQFQIQNDVTAKDEKSSNINAKNDKQSADELIEEYERKINKTIQLLEEEKKKVQAKTKVESTKGQTTLENNAKSTPDFKTKKEIQKLQENSNYVNLGAKDITSKNTKKQAQSYLSELSKGHLTNIDNMKLIKQINNCFGDNLNVTAPVGTIKQKQKLNKSFENLFAQNKSNLKAQVQEVVKPSKKNLSSSPKRGSLSGKKSGQAKVSSQNRKKYLDQNKNTNGKALYNMRDLNFFIKTIEKDLSEKFNKLNMKDFSSVPTTPTSILKKVEEQVKAQAQFKDGKAYMSNTCPNIAQILGSLDTSQASKSNHALQISDMNNMQTKLKDISSTSNHTPSNVSYQNMFGGIQSQNMLIDPSNNNFDKFSFSKTQKLDLKDVTKGLFPYNKHKEGNTQRDFSGENNKHKTKFSPKNEDKYSNLMKQIKEKGPSNPNSKRSKGSQDKYRNTMLQNPSSSSSQSKLNKSANNIGSMPYKTSRKEPLSKSFINMKIQAANVSPHSKKNNQPILLSQLTAQGNSILNNGGGGVNSSQNSSQYSHQNNVFFDYNQANQ